MTGRLAPEIAKRLRSGRPCLDFAHTAATAEWVEPELVVDAASLQRWLGHVLGTPVRARPGDLPGALRLRAAILRLARTRAAGGELPADDIDTVNACATAPTPVPRLAPDGTSVPPQAISVPTALSLLARDAIDLLTGPLGHRVRVCAADDCAYLFVDASRPGTRRWCSMQRCGNLAKVRAHRAGRR